MKKLLSVILIFTLVFSVCITGCNKTDVNGNLSSSAQDLSSIAEILKPLSSEDNSEIIDETHNTETTKSNTTNNNTNENSNSNVNNNTTTPSNATNNNHKNESNNNTNSTVFENKPVQNPIIETEVFADIFRTDYIYSQGEYCSDGRNIYSSLYSKLNRTEFLVYDTLTRTYETFNLKLDSKQYITYSLENFLIYNGYVTACISNDYGSNGLLIYEIKTKKIELIHDLLAMEIESAFVLDKYIYVMYGSDVLYGSYIDRLTINANETIRENIINGVQKDYAICGKYIFANQGYTNEMFRLDLSDGTITNYDNGLLLKKIGFLQSDNWIMTNKGVFDVNSNSIKYEDRNFYIYGDVGVKFTKMTFNKYDVEFLNFKTGDRLNKNLSTNEGIVPTFNSKRLKTQGCTYNGIYFNNFFFKFVNKDNSIEFEEIKGPCDFKNLNPENTDSYGCLFVLNDCYYFVLRSIKKAPLNDISNYTGLSTS